MGKGIEMKKGQLKETHTFGGPPTSGTSHCFKCGAIRAPDGKVTLRPVKYSRLLRRWSLPCGVVPTKEQLRYLAEHGI